MAKKSETESKRGKRISVTNSHSAFHSEGPYAMEKELYMIVPTRTYESIDKWKLIYEKVTKQASSPSIVARRFLHYAMRRYKHELENGDINPYSRNCKLP